MNKSKLLIALIGLSATGVAFAGGTVRQAPVEAPAEVAPAPAPAPTVVAPAPAPVVVAPAFVPSWYAGLGITDVHTLGDNNTGVKVFAGYRFHPNFAAEVTYNRLASNLDSVSIDALGILPVGYNFDLFAKVGVADTRLKDTAFGDGWKAGANYGVGAAYHFNHNWSARAEAERLQKVGESGDHGNVYSISAQYNF